MIWLELGVDMDIKALNNTGGKRDYAGDSGLYL